MSGRARTRRRRAPPRLVGGGMMHNVQVIAHRGASAYAPENTVSAFDLALRMGADALETDFRLSADGVLVLCHDGRVDRVSDGHGEVASFTLAELRRLDFGGWLDVRFSGERIVTASEFLQRYGGRCPLALEIKAEGVAEPLAAAVAAAGLAQGVVFTSFELAWLERLHDAARWARIGYLTRQFDEAMIARLHGLGFEQICPAARDLTAPLVAAAKAAGLVVRAWGIEGDASQDHALRCGVDGMTTNWPDRLVAALGRLPPSAVGG